MNRATEQMMSRLCASVRRAKLWIQYVCCINIFKLFIEKTGYWQNHLGITAKLLNLFAATGHVRYAKSARLYLLLMNDLPSTFRDLHEQLIHKRYHVVKRSNRFWNGIWTDLVIGQVLMRSLKTRGGLTCGRGTTENVVLTWVHNMHVCAQVHVAVRQPTGNHHKTSNQHVKLEANRIKCYNNDLVKIQL